MAATPLDSLTGAYSAQMPKAFRKERIQLYLWLTGGGRSQAKVGATIRAQIKYDMRHLTVAAVGHTPQGFGFGRALDLEMLENFGASLESIEARELIDIAKGYSDEDVKDYLADAGERMCGLENTPEQNRKDFAQTLSCLQGICDGPSCRGIGIPLLAGLLYRIWDTGLRRACHVK